MTSILFLLTKATALSLLGGEEHPSGFWAEEFVVPYERFLANGYRVDVGTIGGEPPRADQSSLDPHVVRHTRPVGSVADDAAAVAHYREVIDTCPALASPLDVCTLTRDQVERYRGVYICGGHGAMEDMPYDKGMSRVARWALELDKPLATLCHGHSALLPLRDSSGRWPLAGYRMTAFSQQEELATEVAGQLPFVLQVELERLGARYQKAPKTWGSCVVEDRNLLTGQNPYSSTALTDAFMHRLG